MTADIVLKRKEAKTITLTVVDAAGNELPIEGATLTFAVKRLLTDEAALITRDDEDFDKTDAASGIVTFKLSAEDTDRLGVFLGELKMDWDVDNILKSATLTIEIGRAVTD